MPELHGILGTLHTLSLLFFFVFFLSSRGELLGRHTAIHAPMSTEYKQDPEQIAEPAFIDGDSNMDLDNHEEDLKNLPRYTPGDPFGDEENSGGVKYKVLNWW